MQDKNKKPLNDKGERHGHWEEYYYNGQLYWKGLYINDKHFGKFIGYHKDGTFYFISNFIDNVQHGYYQIHYFDGEIEKTYYAR